MKRKTGRNATLVRVLTLLKLLEGRRRYDLLTLAERLDVTVRTVRRDLRALEDVGYPIGHESERYPGRGIRGTWWMLS